MFPILFARRTDAYLMGGGVADNDVREDNPGRAGRGSLC